MTNTELETKIESLMDATSTVQVLDAISVICRAKAIHLRVNWQDHIIARQWDKIASQIERCSNSKALEHDPLRRF